MNLLIIGNGFDLAHHLPTQYSDFLDFVKAYKGLKDSSDYDSFIKDLKENNEVLYSEIQDLVESNILIDYFLSVYEDRCNANKNGWIDFESEIAVIVQKLDEAKQYVYKKFVVTNEPVKLEKGLANILKPIIKVPHENKPGTIYGESSYEPRFFDYQAKRVLDALNRLTRLLEIYLHEYVEKLECRYRISDLDNRGIDKILSFNYTDTYKRLYDPNGKAEYCYIHGKTKDGSIDDCDLILGIDEYLPVERKDSDNQFVWFKKFYQRIYKQTGSEYLDWVGHFEEFNEVYKKAKPTITNISIYGHSLDVTDKDVLSRLILMDNTITYIFYHSREALAKQISNLVKVIGEDNLIRMTGGKNRSIRFIQSKPAVEVCS